MAEGPEHVVYNANRRGGYHHHRGRGRARPVGVLDKLGVHDLREHLDRKRENRGADHDENAPPPDPKYNYLQDPEREKRHEHPQPQPHHSRPHRRPNNNRNENVAQQQPTTPTRNKPHFHHQTAGPSSRDIENPVNIKIEFSPSTGEHTYELDEEKVLPTIKHVPDKKPMTYNRSFRGGARGNYRGRGRGGGFRRNFRKPTEEEEKELEQGAKVDKENNHCEGETAAPETSSTAAEVVEDKTKEGENVALPPIEQNKNQVSANQLNDNNAGDDKEEKKSVPETPQEVITTEKEE